MAVTVRVVVIVAVQMRLTLGQARVLAEHQRLDRHRHGHRWQPDLGEVDVIEVPQHHAVDRQDLAFNAKLLEEFA